MGIAAPEGVIAGVGLQSGWPSPPIFILKESVMATPLNGRVLVKRDDPQTVTQGGIIIAETAQKKAKRGRVVAVGGPYMRHGLNVPIEPTVKVGELVYFAEWSGDEVEIDGEPVMVMREEDILLIQDE